MMLLHETEGIMLFEKESSSTKEWRFEVLIPHKESDPNIEMFSMMQTAGGPMIATSKQWVFVDFVFVFVFYVNRK